MLACVLQQWQAIQAEDGDFVMLKMPVIHILKIVYFSLKNSQNGIVLINLLMASLFLGQYKFNCNMLGCFVSWLC